MCQEEYNTGRTLQVHDGSKLNLNTNVLSSMCIIPRANLNACNINSI